MTIMRARSNTTIYLGISPEDYEDLKENKCQHIDGDEIGIGYEIVLLYGRNQEALAAELASHGMDVPFDEDGKSVEVKPATALEYYRLLERELRQVPETEAQRKKEVEDQLNRAWFRLTPDQVEQFVKEEQEKANGTTTS